MVLFHHSFNHSLGTSLLKRLTLLITALIIAAPVVVQAGVPIYRGRLVSSDEYATLSEQEHFQLGLQALQTNNWKEASKQFQIVHLNFPNTPTGQEALYFEGMALYNLCEYDLANESFNQYLKGQHVPEYFEEAIQYKYEIANQFRDGAPHRAFGTKVLPKILPDRARAIDLYEEVASALPNSDIAARSLEAKAKLHLSYGFYTDCVATYMQLIKRFPRHELAPEAYKCIADVYLSQGRREGNNPDLLILAQMNYKRFQADFPRDERLAYVEGTVYALKERYAHALYATGRFYERKYQPGASAVYYKMAIAQFPDTSSAESCRERLHILAPKLNRQAQQPSSDAHA